MFYGHAIAIRSSNFGMFAEAKGIISIIVVILNTIFEFFKGAPLFYCLSGFLIWDSIERSKDLKEYARKRIFRIYPELWGAVAVSLISIIVLYKEKINWPKLILFGFTQGTVFQFWTPDFLRNLGNGTPNGALWTICIIVQFYIICWFVHKILKGKRLWIWCTVLLFSIAVGWASPILGTKLPTIVYKLYNQTFVPYVWLFLTGCFMAEFYDAVIPFVRKYWWATLLVAVIWIYFIPFDINIGLYPLMGSLLCCTACFGFAYAFPRLNLKTDVSYGIYLYHMVVINIFEQLGLTNHFGYFVIAFVIIILCAFISTKTVGKMGLKMKTKA